MSKWAKVAVYTGSYFFVGWGLLMLVIGQIIFPWIYSFPRLWDPTVLPREEALNVVTTISILGNPWDPGAIVLFDITAWGLTYVGIVCLAIGICLHAIKKYKNI